MKERGFTPGNRCQVAEHCIANNECILAKLHKGAWKTRNMALLEKVKKIPPCGTTEEQHERRVVAIPHNPN